MYISQQQSAVSKAVPELGSCTGSQQVCKGATVAHCDSTDVGIPHPNILKARFGCMDLLGGTAHHHL